MQDEIIITLPRPAPIEDAKACGTMGHVDCHFRGSHLLWLRQMWLGMKDCGLQTLDGKEVRSKADCVKYILEQYIAASQ